MPTQKNDKLITENKTFAEKHPKFNVLIVMIILISLSFFAIWLIRIFFINIKTQFTGFIAMLSKWDAVVSVALITGAVSITGVIISSIVAKALEYRRARREYLTRQREKPYGEFVEMIYKLQRNTAGTESYSQEEMIEDLSKFSRQITLWGSSKIVNKWNQFRENSPNPEKAQDNLFLLEDIMNDMRKDLGLKKVKKGNLLGFFISDIKTVIKNR